MVKLLDHSHKALLGLFAVVTVFCFVYTAVGAEPLLLWIYAAIGVIVWAPLAGLMIGLAFMPETSIGRRSQVASVLLPLLVISMAVTYWPMRVTFWFHKAEFEDIASQYENGVRLTLPMRVGLYEVRRVEMRRGNLGLHIRSPGMAGTHFVFRTPASLPGPLGFNTNWEFYLGDDWYYVYED